MFVLGKRIFGVNLIMGICLIIKINIYIENKVNLVVFFIFLYFKKGYRGFIYVLSSWVGKDFVFVL